MSVGTVIWTAPSGQAHVTRPGCYGLFPKLCEGTAPVVLSTTRPTAVADGPLGHELAMPRRQRTRAQDRAARVEAERRLNDALVAERNIPPPF